MIRHAQIAQDAASSSARLQTELVLQIVQRSVAVLARRGIMAPIRVDGRQVDVEFEGPLARAQQNEDVLNAVQTLEALAPLGPAGMIGSQARGDCEEDRRGEGPVGGGDPHRRGGGELQKQMLQVGAQMAEAQGLGGPAGPGGPQEAAA